MRRHSGKGALLTVGASEDREERRLEALDDDDHWYLVAPRNDSCMESLETLLSLSESEEVWCRKGRGRVGCREIGGGVSCSEQTPESPTSEGEEWPLCVEGAGDVLLCQSPSSQ